MAHHLVFFGRSLSWLLLSTASLLAQPDRSLTKHLYDAPGGKGTACSLKSPCSLIQARNRARELTRQQGGDLVIYLRGGVYPLTEPFALGAEDSGQNGFTVSYQAFENETPILSGGRPLTGWTLHEKGIYKATVGPDVRFRQLYLNGKRLVRARTPNGEGQHRILFWDVKNRQIGVELADINRWKHFRQIEMVAGIQWSDARMRLDTFEASVASSGWVPGNFARLTVQEPERSTVFSRVHPSRVSGQAYHFENAYEFIDQAGEWYLDETEGVVYLKPPAGVNLSTAEVIAPALERLLTIQGTAQQPVHHLRIAGLTLMHTNWNYPGQAGHVPVQGGHYIPKPSGTAFSGHPVAGVYVTWGKNLTFERNTLVHFGASGLDLHFGVSKTKVIGNIVQDMAGNGISVGRYHEPAAMEKGFYKNPLETCEDIEIANNLVTQVGQDYSGSIGISCGYVAGTDIHHNEVFEVPYLGISVGWGWSKELNAMRSNQIRHNHLWKVMQLMEDGAAIYTLSNQPGSRIFGNYIHAIKPSRFIQREIIRGIYLDEGSAGFTVGNNAIEKGPIDEPGYHMTEEIGFHRVAGILLEDDCCQSYRKDIKQEAGLQPAYADLRQRLH